MGGNRMRQSQSFDSGSTGAFAKSRSITSP
jgi:hypothetical protein